jgi:hypothetical protein
MNVVKRIAQFGQTTSISLHEKGDCWINLSKAQLPKGVEATDIAVGDILFLHFGAKTEVLSVTKPEKAA